MADTSKPIKPGPKAMRFPENRFRSLSDFKLHQRACDQIDAGLEEALEFYLKKQNTGFVMTANGGRQPYFFK